MLLSTLYPETGGSCQLQNSPCILEIKISMIIYRFRFRYEKPPREVQNCCFPLSLFSLAWSLDDCLDFLGPGFLPGACASSRTVVIALLRIVRVTFLVLGLMYWFIRRGMSMSTAW